MKTERIGETPLSEKKSYVGYLVNAGKITRKTAKVLLNDKAHPIIKQYFEAAKYDELNDYCETMEETYKGGIYYYEQKC